MRSALVCLFPALVIAGSWLRLETPQQWARVFALIALALLSALPARLWQRLALLAIAAAVAAEVAHYSSRTFWNGVLDFYDVRLPFDPSFRPEMHLVLLVATFGFAAALALASRRPLAAVLVLLVGAGWPATLLAGGQPLLRGAGILAAALVLLAGLRRGAQRTAFRAALAGAALVGVALVAATQPAVAKDELLHWQRWDFYTRPAHPVGVNYVWDARYDGFTWPKRITTVFKVKAPATSVYWRATVLDSFDGVRWHEQLTPVRHTLFSGKIDVTFADPLAVPRARDPGNWHPAEFDIRALADDHLVAPSGATAYSTSIANASFAEGGVATVAGGLRRGDAYTVWSYEPQPSPRQLAASAAVYPPAAAGDLALVNGYNAPPAFGAPGRDSVMARVIGTLPAVAPFYSQAKRIAGDAGSPYGAALALESWFRSTGGFTYTQHPPAEAHSLEGFLRVKRGYCQHFAGAMALMLRTLGIPARVAEGFTSGTYDASTRTWTVTDHDAHAWVEAWFSGYGWLPFDPTPGRGSLSAPYSISSPQFRVASVASLVGGVAGSLLNTAAIHQDVGFGEKGTGVIFGGTDIRHPKSAAGGTSVVHRGGSLGRLLAIVLAALLALLAVAKFVRRQLRYATPDPRRQAAACRADLVDFLADQRIPVAASAAPGELAAVLRDALEVDARPFAAALAAARFGPPAGAHAAALRARRELAALRVRIRRRVGVLRRVRGFLSLRSLGVA